MAGCRGAAVPGRRGGDGVAGPLPGHRERGACARGACAPRGAGRRAVAPAAPAGSVGHHGRGHTVRPGPGDAARASGPSRDVSRMAPSVRTGGELAEVATRARGTGPDPACSAPGPGSSAPPCAAQRPRLAGAAAGPSPPAVFVPFRKLLEAPAAAPWRRPRGPGEQACPAGLAGPGAGVAPSPPRQRTPGFPVTF